MLAIHGATLHGRAYDRLGRELLSSGIITVAPDMRGCGQFRGMNKQIDFEGGKHDLVLVLKFLPQMFPNLPIFCLGESVGANLAVWAAAVYPELVDGLILSSPCVKIQLKPSWTVARDILWGLLNPTHPIELKPYVIECLSGNKKVTESYLSDPLTHHKLCAQELLRVANTNENCLELADFIPAKMPVMILEGQQDSLYASDSVAELLSRMPSDDKTICWQSTAGHLLLETPHIDAELLNVVRVWLKRQLAARKRAASKVRYLRRETQAA